MDGWAWVSIGLLVLIFGSIIAGSILRYLDLTGKIGR